MGENKIVKAPVSDLTSQETLYDETDNVSGAYYIAIDEINDRIYILNDDISGVGGDKDGIWYGNLDGTSSTLTKLVASSTTDTNADMYNPGTYIYADAQYVYYINAVGSSNISIRRINISTGDTEDLVSGFSSLGEYLNYFAIETE
jgi:hypothetical protein